MHVWSLTDVLWNNANWTWGEQELARKIEEFLGAIPPYGSFIERQRECDNLWKNDKEKRKKLIKLICKVKGENFDETKELKENIKVTIKDMKILVKSVLNVDVTVTED